jgi:hypothetical protein
VPSRLGTFLRVLVWTDESLSDFGLLSRFIYSLEAILTNMAAPALDKRSVRTGYLSHISVKEHYSSRRN